MNELDILWAQKMQEAITNARTSGRTDVAEYLALKQTNDAFRSVGCRWLFESFIELSDAVNRKGIRLDIENENPHRFSIGHATMVGSLLKFNHGLRNLTVQAGWTRTPQDGFIRGGGLACARISHFGMSKLNVELLLIKSSQSVPQWVSTLPSGNKNPFSASNLSDHFNAFLGVA